MSDSNHQQKQVSVILEDLFQNHKNDESLSFDHLIHVLGRRAFGISAVFFALPSALPLSAIPGFSFVFSLPIIFIAIQIILGRNALWLPKKLGRKQVNVNQIQTLIRKANPWLKRLEKILKPRLAQVSALGMQRVHGIFLLVLAILLSSPIPLSNALFGILIVLLGLGLTENDGILILVTYVLTAIYLAVLVWLIRYLMNWFLF
jgi:hypothetical protein